MTAGRKYVEPSSFEKTFSRFLGFLAGVGLSPSYVHLLQVRGRKSGKLYSTAVNLVHLNRTQYLVAPRGRTQWARNAEVVGEVVLKRGAARRFRLRPLADSEKPPILKLYLTDYKTAVGKFFPIPPDAALESFAEIAPGYPVFELIPG